jgi:hypothetical protein
MVQSPASVQTSVEKKSVAPRVSQRAFRNCFHVVYLFESWLDFVIA